MIEQDTEPDEEGVGAHQNQDQNQAIPNTSDQATYGQLSFNVSNGIILHQINIPVEMKLYTTSKLASQRLN